MFHSVAITLFAILAYLFISKETGKKVSVKKQIGWLLVAIILPLIASLLDKAAGGKTGNFLLHSIGGGMASTLLFYYLVRTFKFGLNWRIEMITLFAFVSCLGVLNELLEYFIEVYLKMVMSLDTHDTWRDLLANSLGALVAYILVRLYLYFIHEPVSKKGAK